MKALVYTAPEILELRDLPDPAPAEGEALVEIARVGICGSDMHAYLGHDERRPAPLTLGHEVAGTARGARVTVNPLVTCGECPACRAGRDNLCPRRQIISMPPREGGFAERVALPDRNLVPIPDDLAFDRAALAEPLACGWHAVGLALAHPAGQPGARALVLGGGAIGLGAALCLAARGLPDVTVVEPNAPRRRYLQLHTDARAVGTDEARGPFDVVVDGVGFESTRAAASALVRPGGIIVHIGLGSPAGGLDIRRMTLQDIAFSGSYTYTAQDFRDTVAAMAAGRLGALGWTETRPLSQGARAFADIRAGRVAAPKILLDPTR